MLLSHSKKFIFIHVYKVAGTSINRALGKYGAYSSKTRNPVKRIKNAMGWAPQYYIHDFPGHITASELKNQLPTEIFDSYFKFAFVRHPLDWQVSLYHFALQDPDHFQHELTKSFGSFDEYIRWRVDGNFVLQQDFICDDEGKVLVDFVGKFETLNEDFRRICHRLKIHPRQLPHSNPSKRGSYKEYYSPETEKMVRQCFAADFEKFDY